MANVPGGDTGLYRKRVTVSGTGEKRKVSIEYIVDTPTLKIMLEHEKQAAIESGQWQSDADTPDDNNRGRVVIGLPDDQEDEVKPLSADALTAAGKRIPVR